MVQAGGRVWQEWYGWVTTIESLLDLRRGQLLVFGRQLGEILANDLRPLPDLPVLSEHSLPLQVHSSWHDLLQLLLDRRNLTIDDVLIGAATDSKKVDHQFRRGLTGAAQRHSRIPAAEG